MAGARQHSTSTQCRKKPVGALFSQAGLSGHRAHPNAWAASAGDVANRFPLDRGRRPPPVPGCIPDAKRTGHASAACQPHHLDGHRLPSLYRV
jgi:hypothetical protein